MPVDALDPGPDGTYPYWPRLADGSPDPVRMPRGLRVEKGPDGKPVLIDITPRDKDGNEIVPPTRPPAP